MIRAETLASADATRRAFQEAKPFRHVLSRDFLEEDAAEALLTLGIAELPGPAGAVLTKAQDEYALSLASFPDVASNHTARGWLEAERGRLDSAQQALDTAIHLQPDAPRPYVLKGVLAARHGRFQEAIDLWKKAKAMDPAYPRIEALIEEAEKRKAGAR